MNQPSVSGVFGRTVLVIAVLCAPASLWAAGKDAPKPLTLAANDVGGAAVHVPDADKLSVLLFVRLGQEQSGLTVANVKRAMKTAPAMQVLTIVSGKPPVEDVRNVAATLPGPLVLDAEFKIVGEFRIRVWPTTVLVLPDGTELARVAGLPPSYVSDLSAYVDFATGKIDRKTLGRRLATASVVTDSPRQISRRHLQVAQRLLARDEVAPAVAELDLALKYQPKDPLLLLTKARAMLLLGKPEQALSVLDSMDDRSSLASSIGVLKGGALVELKEWDQAIPVLKQAVKLNPNPSEGYYFLGVAYQHENQWPQAAAAFRRAYETSPAGRLVARSLQPASTRPSSQPATQPAAPAKSGN